MLSVPMPSAPTTPSRYPHTQVAKEIEAVLDGLPRGTKKKCADAAGITQSDLRNRITERKGYRFSVDEIGCIAAALGAPTGWPFVKWADGEKWDAWRKLMSQIK